MLTQLFPWPIYIHHYDGEKWATMKEKIKEFINRHPVSEGKYQPYSNYGLIRNDSDRVADSTKLVNELFNDSLTEFGSSIGAVGIDITLGWTQTSLKNQEQIIHNHENIGFSATCYVEYDPDEHTPTVFYEPLPSFWDGNKKNVEIPGCKEGTVIFFPAYADHFTRPNNSDKPRVIMAFNFTATPHESVR